MKFKKPRTIEFIDVIQQYTLSLRKKHDNVYARNILLIKYLPIIALLIFGLWYIAIPYWFIFTIFFDHRKIYSFKPEVNVWFGVPGTGKTSMGALLSKYSRKSNINVLSNFELKGAYRVTADDLGVYDMSFDGLGCHCLLDEASSDFDNRNFKAFANSDAKDYFSFHRHQNNRVDVFSQGYDIDKRIRDRTACSGLYHLIKSPIKGFLIYRNISKILFIKKDDKQMIDGFKYRGLPRIIRSKSVWQDFDSLDLSHCPKLQKCWVKWDDIIQ